MQIVTVQWTAVTAGGYCKVLSLCVNSLSIVFHLLVAGDVSDDVEPSYGVLYFISNQVTQDIDIRIKADNTPEPDEVWMIQYRRTYSTHS